MARSGSGVIGSALLVALATAAAKPAFTYTYPAQARAIPALRAWLDRQAAAFHVGMKRDDAAARADAAKGGFPYNRYSADRTWKVVTDLPRFLSLSLDRYDYTGGAHGNPGFGSLVWDRRRQLRMRSINFFVSAAALRAAIDRPFCAQLNREREEKRGGPVTPDKIVPEFGQCIDPTGQTLILGSTDHQRFDRIGAPYAAGPYSDGEYEMTLPVTPAVLATVRPEFRGYFALPKGPVGTP